MSKFDCKSTILSNKKVAENHFKIKLSCPLIAQAVRPGQFVTVRIDNRFDPLLRRPFSVYKTDSDQLEIVYQVVGRGTKILSKKSPEEKLQLLGPIGNGFTTSSKSISKAILVGGGIGVASLMLLTIELRKKEFDVIALVGAASQNRLIGVRDLESVGARVFIATEDGTTGYHGLVTELLEDVIEKNCVQILYACGPYGMLKSVADTVLAEDIPAQFSFESRMACGLGACLGCAIKIRTPDGGFEYKRVCHDGPVFSAQEVVFDD